MGQGTKRSGPLPYGLARQAVWFLYAILASRQLSGGQKTQSPCSGNRLSPVVDAELAVDIVSMDLDCVQGQEKPGSDFLIDQSFGDEFKYF